MYCPNVSSIYDDIGADTHRAPLFTRVQNYTKMPTIRFHKPNIRPNRRRTASNGLITPHIAGEIAGESRRLLPFRRKNAIFAANMALRAETGAPGFHPNEL